MLAGLETLTEWPETVVVMQRNWIGRSEGARLTFPVAGADIGIEIFTTRIDTIYGATFVLLAPEHPLVDRFAAESADPAAFNEQVRQFRSLDRQAARHGVWFATRTAVAFWTSQVGLMLRGQWFRFGYACVNFGGPISARDWLADHGGDLRGLDKDQRFEVVGRLAKDVMGEIARLVPVLPVSLMATVLLDAEGPLDELELKVRASDLIAHFECRGARLYLPRGDRDYAIHVGLRMLSLRRLVHEGDDGLFAVVATERPILAYYANAIAHLR